jgi:hypothetical protein
MTIISGFDNDAIHKYKSTRSGSINQFQLMKKTG